MKHKIRRNLKIMSKFITKITKYNITVPYSSNPFNIYYNMPSITCTSVRPSFVITSPFGLITTSVGMPLTLNLLPKLLKSKPLGDFSVLSSLTVYAHFHTVHRANCRVTPANTSEGPPPCDQTKRTQFRTLPRKLSAEYN